MRKRYRAKKYYEWSEELAYCIGLIASDGCLSSDGRHIDLTSKDITLLKSYRKIVSPKAKIGKKKNGNGQISYRVQISNVSLYDFLLKIGLTPNKSKTLRQIEIPPELYADFLRGYFDGDGTVHGYWDKRWPNSLMYYCEFTSASIDFLNWIQKMNSQYAKTGLGRIKSSGSAEALSYAKTDSRKIFDFIYYSKSIPLLHRKKKRFIDLISQDPYAS